MATGKALRRVCWDSCAWIALIQGELIVENGVDRVTRCRTVIEQAKKGKIEILYSSFCLAEVCKNGDLKDTDPDKVAAFFEHDFLLPVSLDREVGNLARKLMMSGLPGLKPADACHLATAAIVPDVVELQTFDQKLLNLDGRVMKADNTALRVVLPDVGEPPPPLFEGAAGG